MAKQDMTIAEQLSRAAQALEQIDPTKNTAAPNGNITHSPSPAPAGSLSAELLRSDGFLRYGR